jgi:TRAP transporter TAXI family solute receptor
MKRKLTAAWIACLLVPSFLIAGLPDLHAEETFITIGSGDISGVYFPVGLAMARMLNDKRPDYGIRATVEATEGSTFNIKAITAGYFEFGLTQSDKQYQAVKGLAEWSESGPQGDLRSVFSLHLEAVTLVAAVDVGIRTTDDLKGKRVSLGNPGSSQHRTVVNALKAVGLDPRRDIDTLNVMASDAPTLLQDNRIDAYFFTVGHPSETIRRALSSERQARLVPISGPGVAQLVLDSPYFVRATIPVGQLYPNERDHPDVATFGVIATLCTSAGVPSEIVYMLTKEVLDNLATFRRQHPALNRLTREGMLEGLSAPLHPGALRYFREAGLMP